MLPYITGNRNRFAQQLFTPLPHRYDRLAEVLSMGQNGRWRPAMIDHIAPASPHTMLDVASGRQASRSSLPSARPPASSASTYDADAG